MYQWQITNHGMGTHAPMNEMATAAKRLPSQSDSELTMSHHWITPDPKKMTRARLNLIYSPHSGLALDGQSQGRRRSLPLVFLLIRLFSCGGNVILVCSVSYPLASPCPRVSPNALRDGPDAYGSRTWRAPCFRSLTTRVSATDSFSGSGFPPFCPEISETLARDLNLSAPSRASVSPP